MSTPSHFSKTQLTTVPASEEDVFGPVVVAGWAKINLAVRNRDNANALDVIKVYTSLDGENEFVEDTTGTTALSTIAASAEKRYLVSGPVRMIKLRGSRVAGGGTASNAKVMLLANASG